jgi:hypothetical protein
MVRRIGDRAALARILSAPAAAACRLLAAPQPSSVFFGGARAGRPRSRQSLHVALSRPANAPQFPFGHGGTPGAFALSACR